MLPRSRSHWRTRLVTSCSISAAGTRSPVESSVRSLVISDIVAVPRVLLDRVGWRHPVAVAIKQHPGEQARLASSCARVALGGVAGKLGLDRIPQRRIDNRLMFAKIRLFVVNDLAPIDAVAQYQVERTAGEWLATREAARGARPQLALDAPGFQFVLQQPDRTKFGIAAKNAADDFRLVVD